MVAPEKKKSLVGKIVGWTLIVATCGAIGYGLYDNIANMKIMGILRTNAKMQSGYVNPKKLDIELIDLDKNGEAEVVLRYNLRSFLLMEDEHGNPVLRGYSLKPEKKVPAQYIAPEIIQE